MFNPRSKKIQDWSEIGYLIFPIILLAVTFGDYFKEPSLMIGGILTLTALVCGFSVSTAMYTRIKRIDREFSEMERTADIDTMRISLEIMTNDRNLYKDRCTAHEMKENGLEQDNAKLRNDLLGMKREYDILFDSYSSIIKPKQ